MLPGNIFSSENKSAQACTTCCVLGAVVTACTLGIIHCCSHDTYIIDNQLNNSGSMKVKHREGDQSSQFFVPFGQQGTVKFSSVTESDRRQICASDGGPWNCLTQDRLDSSWFGKNSYFVAHDDGVLTPKKEYDQGNVKQRHLKGSQS